jgi:hypothetical protein
MPLTYARGVDLLGHLLRVECERETRAERDRRIVEAVAVA